MKRRWVCLACSRSVTGWWPPAAAFANTTVLSILVSCQKLCSVTPLRKKHQFLLSSQALNVGFLLLHVLLTTNIHLMECLSPLPSFHPVFQPETHINNFFFNFLSTVKLFSSHYLCAHHLIVSLHAFFQHQSSITSSLLRSISLC